MADINKANSEAKELERISAELTSVLKTINTSRDTLKAGWSGTAYTSFVNATNTLANDITSCQKNIISLADVIRGTAKQLSLSQLVKK